MITACALILVVASTVPLNYTHKHVQECASSHKKVVANQCLRDSATSSGTTDTLGLPASTFTEPEKILIHNLEAVDFFRFVIKSSMGAPPLRC
jgi:hypothetical protein